MKKNAITKALKFIALALSMAIPSMNANAWGEEPEFIPNVENCSVIDTKPLSATLTRRAVYNFNYGFAKIGSNNYAIGMSFSDIYTDVAKNKILRAYDTLPKGKCPAPQFRK